MPPGMVTLMVLVMLAFMALACIAALEMKDLLSSVIAIGAAGFGLSIVDLLLKAPDLALTQVVVEILCLVILIRVVMTRTDTSFQKSRGTLGLAIVFLLAGLFLAVCSYAFQGMETFGSPAALATGSDVQQTQEEVLAELAERKPVAHDYMLNGLSGTGAPNTVMSVLLDFRAYDTLGEATVIFAAIIGALAVLRKVGRVRGERHEPDS